MIVKSSARPPQLYHDYDWYRDGTHSYHTQTYTGASVNRIEYGAGPQYSGGRLNWKPCTHTLTSEKNPFPPVTTVSRNGRFRSVTRFPGPSKPNGSLPDFNPDLRDDATQKVVSQFDLNCKDGVLLYSGILQAVPLVGGCFKFVSIMNKVAKRLSRSLRRQPFTTAIKTAISLDFIDRFVVSPTIDDARKFLNAHNYVVNVMNTLAERRMEPVALSASSKMSHWSSSSSFSRAYVSSDRSVWYSGTDFSESAQEYTLFTLAKLEYDLGAVDPVKLWAARTGITRPLESVWDLIPFSFIVDYFSRAGDFISALSSEMSDQDGLRGRLGKIYGQWYTDKRWLTTKRTIEGLTPLDGAQVIGSTPMESSAGTVYFSRMPVSFAQLNSGLLRSDSDLIHWNLTNRRAGTIAELLIQAKL